MGTPNDTIDRSRPPLPPVWARRDLALVFVLAAVALALRLYDIGAESLWLDEAITFERSRLELDHLIENSISHFHLPTYFVLVHYWIQWGDSEAMLRMPSAFFGGATVAATYMLGRVAYDRVSGVVSALIVALGPFHLHYGQEARMYAMLSFACTVAMTGALWLVSHETLATEPWFTHGPKRKPTRAFAWWMTCVAGTVLALYTHNSAVFFAASLGLVALLSILSVGPKRLDLFRNWSMAGAIVVACYLPFVRALIGQTEDAADRVWGRLTPAFVSATVQRLILVSAKDWGIELTIGFFFLFALVLGWEKRRNTVLSLLIFSLGPILMILLVSLSRPMFSPRIMLPFAIPGHALTGVGIAMLAAPLAFSVATLLVIALLGLLPGYYGATRKPQWREAAQYISSSWQEGTAILLIGKRESKPLRYYFRRTDNPVTERKVSTVDPEQVLSRIKNSDRVIAVYARGRKSTATPTLKELRRYGKTVRRVPLHGVAVVELSIDRNRVKKRVRTLADEKH